MEDAAPETEGRRYRIAAAGAIVVLPIVYVLGVGPAFWLLVGGLSPFTHQALLAAYSPIFWLASRWESFSDLLNWYVDLWCRPWAEVHIVYLRS